MVPAVAAQAFTSSDKLVATDAPRTRGPGVPPADGARAQQARDRALNMRVDLDDRRVDLDDRSL
jgi:hypothetical protein